MSLLKSSSREFFGSIIIALLFLSLILSLMPNHVHGNPDWLTGWQYRKSHVINHAAGAGTDYQARVKVSFSTSSPTSWLEILPTNIPVFMTTDVSSDGTVFAGDMNYKIYKSTDSGLTFSNIYTIPAQSSPWGIHAGKVWTVFVDSRDYLFISAGSTNRLYRSTNGGTSFTEVLNLARSSNDGMIIAMTEDASGNLYAAEYANVPPARLWKSTDGGATWSSLRGWSARHLHAVKFNSYNGWLYVVVGEAVSGTTEHQTVWRSKDGGNNWQLIVARGSGTDTKYLPIEFIGNDVYLGQDRNGPTDTDYIQKITDDGVSEPFTPVTVYYNPYPAAIFTAATKLDDTIIFTTSSEGYTATCQVVMSNDGSTWTVLNAQPVSPTYRWINELTVHPRKGIVYGCINSNYAYFIASPSTPRPPPLQAPLDTVFVEGHCKTDFGDIRFTDDDGTTLLDYWMETKVDGEYAIFWVKVADDLSSNPATIYIYYGNPTATTTSNGTNTFLFFDDFGEDLSKWIQVSGTDTWAIESGNLVIQPLAEPNYLITASDIGANNIAIRTKIESTQTPIPSPQAHPGVIWHANTQTGTSHRNDQVYFRPHETGGGGYGNIQPAYYSGSGGIGGSGINFHDGKSGSYYNWNTWYMVEVRIPSSGNVKLYGNDLYWHDWGNQQYSNNRIGLVAHSLGKDYFDYVAVRKFVDPEPSHGVWGAEEAAVPEHTLTIHSSPTGVTFTADGGSYTTAWSGTYGEATTVSLEMPSIHIAGEATYYWDAWSDAVTTRSRTVTIDSDITLTAHYTGPYYEVETASGTGTATFESDVGTIQDLTAVDETTLPLEGKPVAVFTHGLFSFRVVGLTPGQTVTITVTLTSAVPVGTLWHQYHSSVGWISLPIGSDDGDNVITVSITDGDTGDFDPAAGAILDPAGPGSPLPSPPVGIAAKYDLDDETKENDPTIGTEFTTAMYGAIASSDDLYAVTRVLHTYDYSQQIFRFDVAPHVTEFTVAWEGNIAFKEAFLGSPGPHYEGIDIWNRATDSWEYLGNVSQVGDFFSIPGPTTGPSVQGRLPFMAPDEVISKTYKTNVNNYITGGQVYIMVWAKNSHDATISTDHVTITSPPPPVGGVWVPINKTELLAPWITLASLVTVAAVSIIYVKRRKKQQN